jgi:AcrR family transcriptional regulator
MSKDINQKILEATLETIAREKISGTRMHLIAKEADMSQSNLHYYYPTKKDLMVAVLDQLQERFTRKRRESIDLKNKTVEDNIHGLYLEKMDDILNHKRVDYAQFDFWVQGTVDPEIRSKFKKTFDEWRLNISEVLQMVETNNKTDSKYMDMLPFIIVSLMMGASMQYLIDEGNFDLNQYFEAANAMIMNIIDK